jgi:hypothetical protein
MACKTSSAMRLLAPITLVGRTALSVDTKHKPGGTTSAGLRVPAFRGAKHIVQNTLARVVFHHGHMFVGSSVVDGTRTVAFTDRPQSRSGLVTLPSKGTNSVAKPSGIDQALQFLVNVVKPKLVVIKQQ